MTRFKLRRCKVSGLEWKQYNSLQKCPCGSCKGKTKPKRIRPVSEKRKAENIVYSELRRVFLNRPENKVCFIEGCNKPASTIEHRAGRGSNFLNVSTWAPCCLEHNLELENNSELSKKYQLSKIHGGQKL